MQKMETKTKKFWNFQSDENECINGHQALIAVKYQGLKFTVKGMIMKHLCTKRNTMQYYEKFGEDTFGDFCLCKANRKLIPLHFHLGKLLFLALGRSKSGEKKWIAMRKLSDIKIISET